MYILACFKFIQLTNAQLLHIISENFVSLTELLPFSAYYHWLGNRNGAWPIKSSFTLILSKPKLKQLQKKMAYKTKPESNSSLSLTSQCIVFYSALNTPLLSLTFQFYSTIFSVK